MKILFLVTFNLFVTTKDRPSQKDFNNYVGKWVTPQWEDLGIQLDITEEKLDEIKARLMGDCVKCCTEMFKHWCQKYPEEATWETLLEALESPCLEMNDLAKRIREKLLPGNCSTWVVDLNAH